MINTYIYVIVCMIVGFIAGVYLTRGYCKDEIRNAREAAELDALKTIRENYARERHNTKLLLEEVGETLNVDAVELPTFGVTILRGATKVEEI